MINLFFIISLHGDCLCHFDMNCLDSSAISRVKVDKHFNYTNLINKQTNKQSTQAGFIANYPQESPPV